MAVIKSFEQLYRILMRRKMAFFAVFFVTVLLSYAVLYAIDFIPEPLPERVSVTDDMVPILPATSAATESAAEAVIVAEPLPISITFDRLEKTITVSNPTSREVADLDEALLAGAVRHPDSADFSEPGNIFILAHSSYLPNVMNKNFQAFNGIQTLTWGDKVRVSSADTEYVYRVEKVYKAKAEEVFVPETPGEAKLTLATCNSFGSKDDRFIVEATLIGTTAL